MNRTKPYLNKWILQKQLEITDTYHQQNMKEMKPITSKLMEHTETIIINHSKGQKLKEVRQIEIQRENQSLLDKMTSVLSKQGSYSSVKMKNFRTKVNKSLNQIYRKKVQQNIALENQRFQARLINKKPTLNFEKIDRDWKNNKRAMKRMSNCQFYLTSFRPKELASRSVLGSIEIKDKIQNSKLNRTMMVDGHKMQIKIQYMNGLLKVKGEVIPNSKKIQIIQIPKQEALTFIRENCEGKIENIFDKIRYDSSSEILFIVGNQEEEIIEKQKEINPEIQKLQKISQNIAEIGHEGQGKSRKKSHTSEIKNKQSIDVRNKETKEKIAEINAENGNKNSNFVELNVHLKSKSSQNKQEECLPEEKRQIVQQEKQQQQKMDENLEAPVVEHINSPENNKQPQNMPEQQLQRNEEEVKPQEQVNAQPQQNAIIPDEVQGLNITANNQKAQIKNV